MKFKKWLENNNYKLRGEYWITDSGDILYADGDVGDYNHEGYVMMYLQNSIASNFNIYAETEFNDWDKIKEMIIQEILDDSNDEDVKELQYRIDDGEIDEIIIEKMKETNADADEIMAIANGDGDAREYAIMKWGWKRVAGNNIESSSLTKEDMITIATGLNDIDETLADDAEFSISVYGGQHYDVTLAELKNGRLKPTEDESDIQQNDSQGLEQRRRQKQKEYDTLANAASKQVDQLNKNLMHPHYQNKKFPLGDWNSNYFKNWIVFKEGIQINHIDPEDDWDLGDQAYQIANMVNIRPSRDKNPTIVALNDQGDVVGAVFTSWNLNNEASQMSGENIWEFDFDVVVHPNWQGYEQIGIKLIKQAEKEKINMEIAYGEKTFIRTWVVNKKLFNVMTKRWGYEPDSDWNDGGVHVTKYN